MAPVSVSHIAGQPINSTEQEVIGLLLAQQQVFTNSGKLEPSSVYANQSSVPSSVAVVTGDVLQAHGTDGKSIVIVSLGSYADMISRGLINIFKGWETLFHRWAKLLLTTKLLCKKNFSLDVQTRRAKLSSQPVNLPCARPLMKPLDIFNLSPYPACDELAPDMWSTCTVCR